MTQKMIKITTLLGDAELLNYLGHRQFYTFVRPALLSQLGSTSKKDFHKEFEEIRLRGGKRRFILGFGLKMLTS